MAIGKMDPRIIAPRIAPLAGAVLFDILQTPITGGALVRALGLGSIFPVAIS